MRKTLSDTIKADDIEGVYIAITYMAAEWAIAGFMAKSNELLETLWSFKLPHPENLKSIDRDFQIFWEEANQYPVRIPFTLSDLSRTQKDKLMNLFHPLQLGDVTIEKIKNVDWRDLSGIYLWSKALLLTYDPNAKDYYSTKENRLEALAAMETYIASSPGGSYLLDSLIIVIVLALKNRLLTKARYYLAKWGNLYVKEPDILYLRSLLRQRRITKLLLSGHLAPVMQLSNCNFDVVIMEIKAALRDRLRSGRALIYGHLSWKELLQQISTTAIETQEDLEDNIKQSGWLGSTPATAKDIRQTERRLGIVLPKEYKNFLLTSNGFAAPDSIGVTIAPVQQIDWLRNIDDSYLDWYDDISDDEEHQQLSKKIKSALLIGGFEDEQQLFLIPDDTKENWECWFFAFWAPGETTYVNLRFYFEYKLQSLRSRSELSF